MKHKPRCLAHNALMCAPMLEDVPACPPTVRRYVAICNVNEVQPCKTVGTMGRKGERESAKSVEERWKKEWMK